MIAAATHLLDRRMVLARRVVIVPYVSVIRIVTVIDHHKPRAGFDQAARREAAAADLRAAVGVANFVRLIANGRRFANRRRRRRPQGGLILRAGGLSG